jgi:hypothetical protein
MVSIATSCIFEEVVEVRSFSLQGSYMSYFGWDLWDLYLTEEYFYDSVTQPVSAPPYADPNWVFLDDYDSGPGTGYRIILYFDYGTLITLQQDNYGAFTFCDEDRYTLTLNDLFINGIQNPYVLSSGPTLSIYRRSYNTTYAQWDMLIDDLAPLASIVVTAEKFCP